MPRILQLLVAAIYLLSLAGLATSADVDPNSNHRRPTSQEDLRRWLQNMIWHHQFTVAEVTSATGLSGDEVRQALTRFEINPGTKPKRNDDQHLLVLPYPGGRHPRIGFLDGAIRPQRETKFSVFAPWDSGSYIVLDVPEAIWSNLGLTYLAHTHIPTIFDEQNHSLDVLEWEIQSTGDLRCERQLPNGIQFGTSVRPHRDHVQMEMWLVNGTDKTLSDLRVQNCAMLKGAPEFAQQTNDNKKFSGCYAAVRSSDADRWFILAWEPIHRPWGNPPCPCLHADPKFPDCGPGETRRLRGWCSFYDGDDIDAELARIDQTGWKTAPYLVAE